jgi:hypothetical protein
LESLKPEKSFRTPFWIVYFATIRFVYLLVTATLGLSQLRPKEGATMAVTLILPLFGKPGQELNEGGEVTAQQLRDLADDLRARLREAADIVEKLTAAGWETEMTLYDIMLSHPYVTTEVQAQAKLDDLGIDPERVHIEEWPDEEDEIDEGD